MRIGANILIGAGVLGVLLTNAAIYWLSNLGCAMNTTGCRSDAMTVFWQFLRTDESLFFYWLPSVLSVGLVALGARLRRVDKRVPSP